MIIQRHQPPATVSLADVSSEGAGTEVHRVDCWCRTSRHFYFIKDVVTTLMVQEPKSYSNHSNYFSFITWGRFFSVLMADLEDYRDPSYTDMWCQCGNPAELTRPTLWLYQFRGPQSPNHHRQEDRSAWKQHWRYCVLLGEISCLMWGNWLKSTGRSSVRRAMSYLMTPRPRLM